MFFIFPTPTRASDAFISALLHFSRRFRSNAHTTWGIPLRLSVYGPIYACEHGSFVFIFMLFLFSAASSASSFSSFYDVQFCSVYLISGTSKTTGIQFYIGTTRIPPLRDTVFECDSFLFVSSRTQVTVANIKSSVCLFHGGHEKRVLFFSKESDCFSRGSADSLYKVILKK